MNKFKYKINGTIYNVDILDVKDELATVQVNGKIFDVEIEKEAPKPKSQKVSVQTEEVSPDELLATTDGPVKPVKAPLPGVIIKVLVKPGAKVKADQDVCTLETMKMENSIKAEEGGIVTIVNIIPGQSVQQDEVLIEFK